jgi:hypothetical protein
MSGSTEAAQFHDAAAPASRAEPEPAAPPPRGAGNRQPAMTVQAMAEDYDDGIVHGHGWARGASLNA